MDCGRFQSSAYSSPSSTTTGVGRNGAEVRLDADRPRARPAAAVRRREGLVQVEVADVEAEVARARDAEDRVEVGAVHVDLHALGVAHLGDLVDARLEHARACWAAVIMNAADVLVEVRARGRARSTSPFALGLELDHRVARRARSTPGSCRAPSRGSAPCVRRSPRDEVIRARIIEHAGQLALGAGGGLERDVRPCPTISARSRASSCMSWSAPCAAPPASADAGARSPAAAPCPR